MARLSQGSVETQTREPEATTSPWFSQRLLGTCARLCAFNEGYELMMRPDHIFFAMTMLKHGTLAGACIFAYKILRFAVATF